MHQARLRNHEILRPFPLARLKKTVYISVGLGHEDIGHGVGEDLRCESGLEGGNGFAVVAFVPEELAVLDGGDGGAEGFGVDDGGEGLAGLAGFSGETAAGKEHGGDGFFRI